MDDLDLGLSLSVVAWAALHSTDSLVEPVAAWTEQPVVIAGPGSPAVAEFAVPELAVALGLSHDGAAAFLGEAVELAHRLPRTDARVLTGDLRAWKARRIARSTIVLSPEAAAYVDTHVAPTAHKIGYAALDRLVEAAMARFDPEQAETKREEAAEQRGFDIRRGDTTHDGVAYVEGCLDAADALDLEHAVQASAADLAALGSTDSLDVRRSQAAGLLARRQLTFDLNIGEGEGKAVVKARQVVIHVHLADHATGWVETRGSVSVQQVREWCSNGDTQVVVKPIIDLNATPATDSYAIPVAMREQVVLRDPTCVFPHCTVSSRRCDLDHIQAWHTGGRATPPNLAPLCRRHHRLKTHGGWTYHRHPDSSYRWTTRLGQHADHHHEHRP